MKICGTTAEENTFTLTVLQQNNMYNLTSLLCNQLRDGSEKKPPDFKKKDVIMCCVSRAIRQTYKRISYFVKYTPSTQPHMTYNFLYDRPFCFEKLFEMDDSSKWVTFHPFLNKNCLQILESSN
jgi:hypothetical protein